MTDEASNSSTSNLSVYSSNQVTITSLSRSTGTTVGGKYVFIQGTGFESASTITIGGQNCTNSTVYYTTVMMGCTTPASSAGTVNIVVTNSDGSSASTSYTYYTYTGAGSDYICDDPTQPTPFYSGNGLTSTTPYLICTAAQFMQIGPASANRYFKLMDSLDVSSYNTNNFGSISFTSKFLDGNSMVIANWTRAYTAGLPNDANTQPALGLFAAPASSSLSNFGMVNVNVSNTNGAGSVGAIAGYTAVGFTANNVFAHGTVTGPITTPANAGGIIGQVRAGDTYSNVRFFGTVTVSATGTTTLGGLIGGIQDNAGGGTTITNCYSTGTVSSSTARYVGGLVGYAFGSANNTSDQSISGSWSSATVTGASTVWAGGGGVGGLVGIIGPGSGTKAINLTSSYATGNVTANLASNCYVGGLVGAVGTFTAGSIFTGNSLYATGAVSGGCAVGGLFGYYVPSYCTSGTCATLSNSYATGNVTSSIGNAGGLIGYAAGNASTGTTAITNTYATGNVTNATSTSPVQMGGYLGAVLSTITISNSYATGNVTGYQYLGGFAGDVGSASVNARVLTIQTSYATGTVTSTAASGSTQTGGFVGRVSNCANGTISANTVTFSQNYSTSTVVGYSDNGGFAGATTTATCSDGNPKYNFADSYAIGSVTGGGTGNASFLGNAAAGVTLTRTFSTGGVFGTAVTNAGLVGSGTTPTATNSFWDTQTTLQTSTLGSAGTGLTTSQMKTQASFAGFDFTTTPIWKIATGQYPKLNWQP